jgi:DNA-binding XRE family transcriptional regulator
MSKQANGTANQDSSRVLDEAAVIVLDQLAVEGGRARRDELFDRCKAAFFGRMVNAAARRAGYDGHDDAEVERRGREQLFAEAVAVMVERQVIVVWDDQAEILALHPTHREPLRVGGPPYVPGTEYWRNQREQALTDLRTQLIQLRDQTFDASLRRTAEIYARQIRRGQLAGDAREEALMSLIALSDVLLNPSRLAQLLAISEANVLAAWQRRLHTTGLPLPANPKKRRQQGKSQTVETKPPDANQSVDAGSSSAHEEEPPGGRVSLDGSDSLDATKLRQEREVRQMTLAELGDLVGVSRTTVGDWERGKRAIDTNSARRLRDVFADRPISANSV